MSMHVDHKGKYFTDIISKDVVRTIIQTLTVRIVGDIYVRPGERLKDELNRSERFIAVTEAVVLNVRGEEIYSSDFLTVNLDHILWLSPASKAEE
ncbi:MAG: hypothetical protein ISR58_16725 [Anaerolineales bacterium]|nr:hypothetical protein [Chloroflexota bacterium]MBL6982819.1 hypothetical protein [Anaerolineales bacterium]